MNDFDHIIIGSGLNSLVCAALLARNGSKVCVLERNQQLGGCIATNEITLPGFQHDLLSSWHPLFVTSGAYAELQEDLERHGLDYAYTEFPAAGLTSQGESFIFTRSRKANAEALAEDGPGYLAAMEEIEAHAELIFPLLSQQLQRFSFVRVLAKCGWNMGIKKLLTFAKSSLCSAGDWLNQTSSNRAYHACVAPWVLHVGLGPESATSSMMAKVVLFTLEAVGLPVVKGGSYNLVSAFKALIEEHGGTLLTESDVSEIIIQNKRATGVKLTDASTILARKTVICNVTPQQLYGQLIAREHIPDELHTQANNYRFGRADMQIHIAMDKPAQWKNAELNNVAMIHLSDGIDALSKAVNQSHSGLLPEQATIVVGQPCAVDPSRAPDGKWILWLQLQELPSLIKGDAAGDIQIPESGEWNDEIKELYADRIIRRLNEVIINLDSNTLKRVVLSPKDLQTMNVNLVGGDPYSGDCALDQNLFMRPTSHAKNHDTCIKNVFHIGASTHPGPGLNGGSGLLVAKQLSRGK
ncbi:NAD(P)/FAD-dependent oxidoreductase [Dasania marina]|uniref:phytoene desaturase family protein n=1 Tax=Dasania marina TaxID=471499 RepID=UPI0030DB98E8|tara:strand:+ start:6455 stop:8029 length:1575 start_codon:yes stop_codon:yes gene_type:complete